MKTIFTFLIAILFAFGVHAQKVGDIAPDFTLKDLNNSNYKLSDNKGKVILIFFIGYNCSLCKQSAPTVKSAAIEPFANDSRFQAITIDVWNGPLSSVRSFKNSTGIDAIFLQDGSSVANTWGTNKDQLAVVDGEGKLVFKGSMAARSDAASAKSAVQNALNSLTTDIEILEFSDDFSLGQNYPNPVNGNTNIRFSIGESSNVELSVFDITGKKIGMPVIEFFPAGTHEVSINGNDYNKGVYFYKINAGEFSSTKRMIIQ